MSTSAADMIHAYLRELSAHRKIFALSFFAIAVSTLIIVLSWPKNYTSSSTIYADNSNILQPLLEDNAVATGIGDQARMAQEILFKRVYTDQVLKAAGYNVEALTSTRKDTLIQETQERTKVENVGRSPANLIRISHTDKDPVRAFSIAQKYTSLFIEESVVEKREESKNAFEFIQNQVASYHAKLQASEERLSNFKSENNNGTLQDANARISRYRSEIERLELDLVQLNTEEGSVEGELSGESEVSRGLNEMVALRNRINSLQIQLDSLKSRFHDNYPDVIQVQMQIDDLMDMYETGNAGILINPEDLENDGMTPLHQELRSRLASIKTAIQSKTSQLNGIKSLLDVEMVRIQQINSSEAQLSELTRDYNVTRDFYNGMLKKLENARVSMHLDEEQQGVTFKVQESAVIPTKPDGFGFIQLMGASFVLALAAPFGLLVLYMELDPRIRTETNLPENWPPVLISIPRMKSLYKRRISDRLFIVVVVLGATSIYGTAVALNFIGLV